MLRKSWEFALAKDDKTVFFQKEDIENPEDKKVHIIDLGNKGEQPLPLFHDVCIEVRYEGDEECICYAPKVHYDEISHQEIDPYLSLWRYGVEFETTKYRELRTDGDVFLIGYDAENDTINSIVRIRSGVREKMPLLKEFLRHIGAEAKHINEAFDSEFRKELNNSCWWNERVYRFTQVEQILTRMNLQFDADVITNISEALVESNEQNIFPNFAMCGSPGTGKTSLSGAIAEECLGAYFATLTPPELQAAYLGQTPSKFALKIKEMNYRCVEAMPPDKQERVKKSRRRFPHVMMK